MTNLQSLRNLATAINQPFAKHREMEICRLGMQCNPPMPSHDLARAYMGSVDAAMSLHDARLPGYDYRIERNGGQFSALVYAEGRRDDGNGNWGISDNHASIALLLADIGMMIRIEEAKMSTTE